MTAPPNRPGLLRSGGDWLTRVLDVRPGEGLPLLLLVGHGCFVALPVLLTNIAASALFLTRFSASQLPYVYIADAVVVPLASALFLQLERRLSRIALFIAVPFAIILCQCALRIGLAWSTSRWVVAAALLWVELLATLVSLEYWGVANHVLDVRQGKRLIGIVGAGRTMGLVVAGLAVPLLVRRFGTANLLLASALSALIGLLLVLAIRRMVPALPPDATEEKEQTRVTRTADTRTYVALVLALVAIYHCNYYFIDNAFFAGMAVHYEGADRMSQVLGPIHAANALLLLLFNGLLSGAWLMRFGVSGGLMVLPVALLASTSIVVLAGVVRPASVLLWPIVATRAFEYVFRNSLYLSSLNILYHALSPSRRIRAQALGEGFAGPIASGFAGVTLLVLGRYGFGAVAICAFVMLIATVWIPLTWIAQRAYHRVIARSLTPRVVTEWSFDHVDEPTVLALRRGLDSRHVGEALLARQLLSRAWLTAQPALRARALSHESAEVRAAALRSIELRADGSFDTLMQIVLSDSSPEVRGQALRAMPVAPAGQDLSVLHLDDPSPAVREGAMVSLLRAGEPAGVKACWDRLDALLGAPDAASRASVARVLGDALISDDRAAAMVAQLLRDHDASVRRAALGAVPAVADEALWPAAIACLSEPALYEAAITALSAGGAAVVPDLARILNDEGAPPLLRTRIALVLGQIGGPAIAALVGRLGERRPALRHAVLQALGHAYNHVPMLAGGRVLEEIQSELATATLALSAWTAIDEEQGLLRKALQEEVDAAQGRVMELLSLLHPRREVVRVAHGLREPASRTLALELLDGFVQSSLRAPLFALLEETAPARQLARLVALYPQPALDGPAHIAALISAEAGPWHPWTRACAVDSLDAAGLPDAARLAREASTSDDRFVSDAAMRVLVRLDPASYGHLLAAAGGPVSSLIEKVLILKTVSIFADTADSVLAGVARVVEDVHAEAGECIVRKGDAGTAMYVVVSGRLRIHDADRTLHEAGPREIFGEMSALDSEPRSATVTAIEQTHLLRLGQADLYDVMAERVEIARGIIHILCGRLRTYRC